MDAGHFQLETDAGRLYNEPAVGDAPAQRTWQAGYTAFKLGVSRRTDVQVEVPLYTAQTQCPAGEYPQDRIRGFGDGTLRLKHNFVADDQEQPLAVAVIPCVRLPTGVAGLSSGRAEYGLVLPANLALGKRYNLNAQPDTDLTAVSRIVYTM